VLFCGFREGSSGLTALRQEILALGSEFGERPPESEFTPHVTLARSKSARLAPGDPAFRDFVARVDRLSLDLTVGGVRLYESVLSRSGAEHTLLAEATCAR
jgi:2'-5' RNA ligase